MYFAHCARASPRRRASLRAPSVVLDLSGAAGDADLRHQVYRFLPPQQVCFDGIHWLYDV